MPKIGVTSERDVTPDFFTENSTAAKVIVTKDFASTHLLLLQEASLGYVSGRASRSRLPLDPRRPPATIEGVAVTSRDGEPMRYLLTGLLVVVAAGAVRTTTARFASA